jgi:hypothetical protein
MRPLERLMNRATAIRDQLRSPGSAFPVESNIQDPVMADYSQGLKGVHADPLAAETDFLDIFKDLDEHRFIYTVNEAEHIVLLFKFLLNIFPGL